MTVPDWLALVGATALGATAANGLTALIRTVWKATGLERNPVGAVVAILGPLLLVAGIVSGGIWAWQEIQGIKEARKAQEEERERAGVRADLTGNEGKDTVRLAKICEAHAMQAGNDMALRVSPLHPRVTSVDFKKTVEAEWRACMAERGVTTEACEQGETGCVVFPGSGYDYGW